MAEGSTGLDICHRVVGLVQTWACWDEISSDACFRRDACFRSVRYNQKTENKIEPELLYYLHCLCCVSDVKHHSWNRDPGVVSEFVLNPLHTSFL